MFPCVYFFYPETAYRSLEEMDEIFHKTTNPFNVVKIAHEMPHRFGKNGELLIDYEDTEEYAARTEERRRSSVGMQEKYTGGAEHSEQAHDIETRFVPHR